MKMKPKMTICLSLVFLVCHFFGCTGNPLGDNEVSGGKRQIRGQVTLDDGASPQGVYVWLKGFDLTTQTDENGDFEILLPPQLSQSGTTMGSIVNDTLYFYLANYLLKTVEVTIVEGEFRYASGDIDKNGNVRGPIVMQRFLQINTSVQPPTVTTEYSDTVSVQAQLQANINCATVTVPKATGDRKAQDGPLGAVLVKKLNSDQLFIIEANPNSDPSQVPNFVFTVCATPSIRELKFEFSQIQLPAGQYEIIPYLFVNPESVPRRLLEIASLPFNELGPQYLHKPMRRLGGRFEVRD